MLVSDVWKDVWKCTYKEYSLKKLKSLSLKMFVAQMEKLVENAIKTDKVKYLGIAKLMTFPSTVLSFSTN